MWLPPVKLGGEKIHCYMQYNRYNFEKYRDIHFWSYRPALVSFQLTDVSQKLSFKKCIT